FIKLELGLGRGKKKYEKREAIKKREVKKEIGRTLKTQ
ncbi:MAG: SsrA-binding protein, partial [Patescibacteria group bacterium]